MLAACLLHALCLTLGGRQTVSMHNQIQYDQMDEPWKEVFTAGIINCVPAFKADHAVTDLASDTCIKKAQIGQLKQTRWYSSCAQSAL